MNPLRTLAIVALMLGVSLARAEAGELRIEDFRFDGPMGCDGAALEKVAENHFKMTLAHAPKHPEWANWIHFEIPRNARGNSLRLDVEFDYAKPQYNFNHYDPSWSHDGREWRYVHWQPGGVKGRAGTLLFPEFTEDRVLVGTQLPMTLPDRRRLIDRWGKHPHCKVHVLGKSLEGRNLYRLTVTDPDSPHPPARRWVHHVANQHPGEGVAQWYIAGMIDWLLSDDAAEHRKRTIAHFTLMMDPDGVAHGWCRTNAQGFDMNRTYRVEGADKDQQAHEAFVFQRDLQRLMKSESPVTTSWSMHSWKGPRLEPILVGRGPELGTAVGSWEELGKLIEKNDPRNVVEPLRAYPKPTPPKYWDAGPFRQFGITNMLIEGGGGLLSKPQCLDAGAVVIRSVVEHYRGLRK